MPKNQRNKLLVEAEAYGLTLNDLAATCEEFGVAPRNLLNELSIAVAEGYLAGALTYEFCDGVMNGLIAAIVDVGMTNDMPQPAFSLYQAFDQGEWGRHRRKGDRFIFLSLSAFGRKLPIANGSHHQNRTLPPLAKRTGSVVSPSNQWLLIQHAYRPAQGADYPIDDPGRSHVEPIPAEIQCPNTLNSSKRAHKLHRHPLAHTANLRPLHLSRESQKGRFTSPWTFNLSSNAWLGLR
ncbi:hypothetical protein [Pseudomonas sp. 14P_5.3_Bac1]|uniref:hypothetical protein n=1 Tax=Pseudomonas sp. 14P_5.3_Bac1 TaxID=2971622 RepID=UPI0021C93928|nr:hypothetical protein [Pseudomonas sp. 14P_5.3_Bac1]